MSGKRNLEMVTVYTDDDNDNVITSGNVKGQVRIDGTSGNDTIYAHDYDPLENNGDYRDSTKQIHIYAGDGDDTINMIFYSGGSNPTTANSQGHHVRGDGFNSNAGSDTFNFASIASVTQTVTGRIEDFDATRDHLQIEGEAITNMQLAVGAGTTAAGYSWKIVEYNGDHDDASLTQQWLLIDTGPGWIFYSLEGARVDMEGDGGANDSNQESHFVVNALPNFANMTSVPYVNPHNTIPVGHSAQGGNTVIDHDANAQDVNKHIDYDISNPSAGVSDNGDLISAGLNDDIVYARGGNDYVWGGSGHDEIFGGNGNDTMEGGTGNDTVEGGIGNDFIYGDTGDDLLRGDSGNDYVNGGTGDDAMSGSSGDDSLYGGEGDDTVYGGDDSDLLEGDAGKDRLYGQDGNDTLRGEEGNDYLNGGNGHDAMSGAAGVDTIYGGNGNDDLYGGIGNDRLFGNNNDDKLYGQENNDVLYGGNGNDYLYGGSGNDRLYGGAGNDYLRGDSGSDTFIFENNHGNDTINGFSTASTAERIDLSAVSSITNWNDLSANHLTQVGSNAVITSTSGNTITLLSVQVGALESSDFDFF